MPSPAVMHMGRTEVLPAHVSAKISQTFSFTSAGADNVSADGTSFEVTLQRPINIPDNAVACEVGVIDGSIWNNSPNIGPRLGAGSIDNNLFRYTTSTGTPGTYNITFPTGLYSLTALSSYLSSQFVNNGHAPNLFTLSGQSATGLSALTILTLGDTARFEQVGSVGSILGFPVAAITSTIANQVTYSATIATLNRNNTYLISGTLISGGIPTNATSRGLLAAIPISAKPGSQIIYAPPNIQWTPATELIGQNKTQFSFRLTNERNEATPTAGETWSFTLMLRYKR